MLQYPYPEARDPDNVYQREYELARLMVHQMDPAQWQKRRNYNNPYIPYGHFARFVFRRGRLGPGTWQPVVEKGKIVMYLRCPSKACSNIIRGYENGYGQYATIDLNIQRGNGYHCGACIQCNKCFLHFWSIFQGYERLLELPIKYESTQFF